MIPIGACGICGADGGDGGGQTRPKHEKLTQKQLGTMWRELGDAERASYTAKAEAVRGGP